ncbi:MAG: tetratricopeptide repeat protein [Pedosphaera sp.]|nr:tetratricopeptide repeat protein [Pedosphaera sp.]
MNRALLIGLLIATTTLWSADPLEEAQKAFAKGDYAGAITNAIKATEENQWQEDPPVLHIRALMARGKYAEAHTVTTNALEQLPSSIRVQLVAEEVFHFNNDPQSATNALQEINRLAGIRAWAYRNAKDLVVLGRTALKLGGDPKLVLDNLYTAAREDDPEFVGTALAIGDLALSKSDYELAGRTFQQALKKHPKNAELHFGTALAFASSDRKIMARHLQSALNINTNHIGSRLLLVDHLIDREAYDDAEKQIALALKVNPHHPEAWAYRSVVAHLREDKAAEKTARDSALKYWKTNPKVDHIIGQKLSQKYRFAEGSAHQRQALVFDKDFLPAKIQLAQDLLRLGLEREGWAMAEAAHEIDGYDVTTFNLITLKDTLDKYTTLTNANFRVRMTPHEAAIYGPRALRLLEKAHATLSKKYGLKLEQQTTVEIFADQKDFGVRTFGMPDNPGFLGVCFGCVITANSPASQMPSPANWESVLWHEFCHTITLTLTKNKMPRWLSEGLSVYEERQANPAWGMRMNPRFREMILSDELTPISKLSGAFMSPESNVHLQFAYYESSLVVEHIVERFGLESIRKILRDLSQGVKINDAIAKHTEPMKKLEVAFAKYAKKKAKGLAPELEWDKPDPRELRANIEELAKKHPKNFYILSQQARRAINARDWEAAKAHCRKLIKLFPRQNGGANNPYVLLAKAHRELKEFSEERKTLETLAGMSDDAYDVFLRLIELTAEAKDWDTVRLNCERALAVNPLLPQPHRQLAIAAEAQNRPKPAIESWQTLLELDPLDPAEPHYHLALLLRETDNTKAKRHLLMALEEAPRFRKALRLLLDWEKDNEAKR